MQHWLASYPLFQGLSRNNTRRIRAGGGESRAVTRQTNPYDTRNHTCRIIFNRGLWQAVSAPIHQTPYGQAVSFTNADELHQCIGKAIARIRDLVQMLT
jgi:hypothetical protein